MVTGANVPPFIDGADVTTGGITGARVDTGGSMGAVVTLGEAVGVVVVWGRNVGIVTEGDCTGAVVVEIGAITGDAVVCGGNIGAADTTLEVTVGVTVATEGATVFVDGTVGMMVGCRVGVFVILGEVVGAHVFPFPMRFLCLFDILRILDDTQPSSLGTLLDIPLIPFPLGDGEGIKDTDGICDVDGTRLDTGEPFPIILLLDNLSNNDVEEVVVQVLPRFSVVVNCKISS